MSPIIWSEPITKHKGFDSRHGGCCDDVKKIFLLPQQKTRSRTQFRSWKETNLKSLKRKKNKKKKKLLIESHHTDVRGWKKNFFWNSRVYASLPSSPLFYLPTRFSLVSPSIIWNSRSLPLSSRLPFVPPILYVTQCHSATQEKNFPGKTNK